MKYRSRTDIITMVLESARTSATKTRIMFKAYLSHAQVTEYLKFLQERDLLTFEEGKQIYRVTERGIKFLSTFNELNDLMIPKSKYYQFDPDMQ